MAPNKWHKSRVLLPKELRIKESQARETETELRRRQREKLTDALSQAITTDKAPILQWDRCVHTYTWIGAKSLTEVNGTGRFCCRIEGKLNQRRDEGFGVDIPCHERSVTKGLKGTVAWLENKISIPQIKL